MYKTIEFKTEGCIDKLDCIKQLSDYLNEFDDIAIADIDKEWTTIGGYNILTVIIIYYDFSEEDRD